MRRRRLTRREKRSRGKKAIILSTLCLLFVMTAGYAAFQTNLSITAKGNIKEPSRVIRSWTGTSQEDFHSDYYKENIVGATFLDNNNVPDNATESWNVSDDKETGGVMAWVVPNNNDNTKYDLYIGANGGVIANKNSSYLFYQFTNIENIDFKNNFYTNNVTDMSFMFNLCTNLNNVDVSTFDTSNVSNMNWMFGDTNLYTLDVSNFNTENLTYMYGTFANLYSLTELDISNFDTNNVTTMKNLFANFNETSQLTTLELGDMQTSKVTNMSNMFHGLKNLKELNVSSFDTSNVTDMVSMFYNCSNLVELNLCSFNTYNVNDMYNMFANTSNLKNIYVGRDWSTTQANITYMFLNSGVSSVVTGQCQ